ncbi:UDP-glycosyltransferase UGT5 [Episyrphus balteatus]|uniref:UDP-glycosyltransferase UGT5 n=1 Tax=Episyrphus balteatus TaxID=286459 RepID=UPI00248538E0|nr:UDP-glycosyltransferase UGT5 [Episyrphus balteatus]
MKFLPLTYFVFILCLGLSEQSNILGLFPHFGYSHFKVYSPILTTLAERGHNVTVVTYIKTPDPPRNYHELLLEGKGGTDVFSLEDHIPSRSLWTLFMEFYILHVEGQKSCEEFYNSPHVEEIIRRHSVSPYDMIILEIFNTDCYSGLSYLLQVPVVGLSSCALMPWHYARVALPDTPSYIQSEFIGFAEELSWQERLVNFIQSNGNKILYRLTEWKDNAMIKKYLNLDVDVREIAKTMTSLVFVNQHYSLSGNRPLSAQVKEIGGVHIPTGNKLPSIPKDIDDFLNASNETVLFISFGSMLRGSTISKDKFESIVSAVKKLNLRVIWRWDSEKAPFTSSRFIFPKWAPQFSLLCDPRVNIFWGHGGMLGTTEAVHCGKPLIVTPFYGDQFLNGKATENRKVGIVLNYETISEERVLEVLREIMRARYGENAKELSKVFRNREKSPLSKAIWWIEHVLNENIAKDLLRTKVVNMNWFIYYSLDSIVLLIFSAVLPILIIYTVKIRYF